VKFSAQVDLKLNVTQVVALVEDASRKGLRDVTVQVTAQTIEPPPIGSPVLTGTNRRSIAAEVAGMAGTVAGEGPSERVVDERQIESAVYSTSGYGGFLEVGTRLMPARPYFGPARDRYFTESNLGNAIKGHLK